MRYLRRAAVVLVISMLAIEVVLAYQVREQVLAGYSDFVSGYTAGKILQRGEADHLYDLQVQYAIQREVTPHVNIRHGALPYVRPPFEAWLYRPLAAFSYDTAFCIWDTINLGLLALALAILRREISQLSSAPLPIWVLCVLSFFPVFATLLQGQDSIVLLLIYVLAYLALRRSHVFIAGAILAAGTFKFPLVLPFLVPYIVYRKARFLTGFAASIMLLTCASIATVGWTGVRNYPAYLLNIDKLALGVNVQRDMPNLRGLIAFISEPLSVPMIGQVLLAVASLGLIAFVVNEWNPASLHDAAFMQLGFSLNLTATLLVSYHDHVFDLALLVLPICLALGLLLSGHPTSLRIRRILMWSVAIASFSPIYVLFSVGMRAAGLLALLLLMFVAGLAAANRAEFQSHETF